jgi:hypothetical protein
MTDALQEELFQAGFCLKQLFFVQIYLYVTSYQLSFYFSLKRCHP